MKMSKRAYARHRGCSDTAVRKAVLEGRISADAEGLIDAEQADIDWQRDLVEVRTKGANLSANHDAGSQEVRSAENASLVRQVLAEEGQPIDDEKLTLNHVRMAVGILKAREQQVENEKASGDLLPREEVLAGITASFARVRAKFLALPVRVAPALVAISDPWDAQEALRKVVYEILDELATTVVVGVSPDEMKHAAMARES